VPSKYVYAILQERVLMVTYGSQALQDGSDRCSVSLLPKAKPGGRPRSVDMRERVNAIMYLLHTGIQWEMMPHDLPPYTTVYTYYDQWNKDGYWPVINARLVAKARQAAGRESQPSLSSA
jgi:putative transposase